MCLYRCVKVCECLSEYRSMCQVHYSYMCIRMYVCMYVVMYVCMYACMYVCMYVYIYLYIYFFINIYTPELYIYRNIHIVHALTIGIL